MKKIHFESLYPARYRPQIEEVIMMNITSVGFGEDGLKAQKI